VGYVSACINSNDIFCDTMEIKRSLARKHSFMYFYHCLLITIHFESWKKYYTQEEDKQKIKAKER
jgi:hypothetical protein